jgi:hypothetical protein
VDPARVLVHEITEVKRVKGSRLKAASVYLFNDTLLVAKPKDAKSGVLLCRFQLRELNASEERDPKWKHTLVLNGRALVTGANGSTLHCIRLCAAGEDKDELVELAQRIRGEQKTLADRRRTFEL